MARPASAKSKAIQKFIAEEIMAGNAVDAADIAETYGMSVRSIQYKIAAIRKVLPADMLPKAMATEKQINCVIGLASNIGKVNDAEGLRTKLEGKTMKQLQGVINALRGMKKQQDILKSAFGHFVIVPVLDHINLNDYPYRRK